MASAEASPVEAADPAPPIEERPEPAPTSPEPAQMPEPALADVATIPVTSPPPPPVVMQAPTRSAPPVHKVHSRQEPVHVAAPPLIRASQPRPTSVDATEGPTNPPSSAHVESEQAASASQAAAEASFEGRLLQSIQAEVRRNYPMSARLMGITGQPVIAFEYRDGHVSATRIAGSCGSNVLDQAALAAVQAAVYPQPPKELAGHTLFRQVHVKYELTNS